MAVEVLELSDIDIDDIITAIEGIITDIGYELEDLSNIDIENWSGEPLAKLFYSSETFLDTNGQQSNEAVVSFVIEMKFRETTPVSSRSKSGLVIHNLKHNITPENINDPAKLVIEVFNQEGAVVDYDTSITTINYSFDVRYRNNDS